MLFQITIKFKENNTKSTLLRLFRGNARVTLAYSCVLTRVRAAKATFKFKDGGNLTLQVDSFYELHILILKLFLHEMLVGLVLMMQGSMYYDLTILFLIFVRII